MPEITLCMITKNEEANIEKCLNSVKDLVSEIIIVDSHSTDKTVEIAKKFNAKIIDFKWVDDFSKARNESIKHATKEWILILDADEFMDDKSRDEIKEIIKKDFDAFLLPQLNYTNNRAIAGFTPSQDLSENLSRHYISMICRLFKNNKGYIFSGLVHELVEPSITDKKGKLAVSRAAIHHLGNSDPTTTLKKKQYYIDLSKRKVDLNPTQKNYLELGILYKDTDQLDLAEKFIKISLDIKQDSVALYELGIISEKNQKPEKAIELYKKSLKLKEDPETYFSLGSSYLKMGELKNAFESLKSSLELKPNNYKAFNNLGVIHERNGHFKDAIEMLDLAIKLNPKNVIGYFNLGINYEKLNKPKSALPFYEKAYSLNHPKKELLIKKINELKKFAENNPTYNFNYNSDVNIE